MFTRLQLSWFMKLCFVIIGGCLAYGFFIEPKTLAVRHISIKSQHWKGPDLKIALISDIHIGGLHVNAGRVRNLVEIINAQQADIILLAGDYVNGHQEKNQRSKKFNGEITQGISYLGHLRAPLGVYASTGNHDAWYSSNIGEMLSKAGLSVLDNQQAIIKANDQNFCLVGLADYRTGEKAPSIFNDCQNGQSIISFMHSPDSFSLLRPDTALALAGHTHGGQINIPFIGRRITSTKMGQKYAYGAVQYHQTPTYITSGIGTSILPARFRVPPEIVLITLRSF